jgi:hypothetical protein
MIALDRTLLENTFLLDEANALKNSGFITLEQSKTIAEKLPSLKRQHNLLVRLGFFLLGCILFSSIMGAISVFSMPILESNYELMIFLYAVVGFVVCEFLTKKDYYGFGLDDAFILGSQITLFIAIGITSETVLAVFIAMTVVGLFCCLRYIHTLSALISCVGIAGLISNLIIEHKVIDMSFLPFVMLFLAIGIYSIYNKLSQSPKSYYYKNSLQIAKVFSLILGYASVNYLVVRQLSEELMGLVLVGNKDIPFSFLFYGLTFIVPVLFIVCSLYKKDRTMLIIGFLTLGFSFYTIRYYYSLMPVEIALILGGTILFGLTYFFIKKIKDKEVGVTFKRDRNADSNALLNVQALIINSQLDLKPVETVNQNMPFGGGDFSGGGSGGSF